MVPFRICITPLFGECITPLFGECITPLFGECITPLFGECITPLFDECITPLFGGCITLLVNALHRFLVKALITPPTLLVSSRGSILSRLGLTPDSRSAREDRTFPITGTLNGLFSWNDHTK